MVDAEQWRDVPGFEGYYQVSDLGRVRSLPRAAKSGFAGTLLRPGKVMTPSSNSDGYTKVIFRIDGKHWTRRIHRMVCEVFNGPSNALHNEVHHIDADRTNARASNLRWVSRGENLHLAPSTKGEANGFARLTEAQAAKIKSSKGDVSAKALAETYGVTRATVYGIWSGRRWAHVLKGKAA